MLHVINRDAHAVRTGRLWSFRNLSQLCHARVKLVAIQLGFVEPHSGRCEDEERQLQTERRGAIVKESIRVDKQVDALKQRQFGEKRLLARRRSTTFKLQN